jgi:FtsX-like permease family
MMTGIAQDFRYALRQLGKAPGFAAVAIVTLALGIGANTAIFSLLDQALLRTLPVKDSDRLVILESHGSFNGHTSSRIDENFSFSYPMYRDLRDHNSVFSGLIATTWTQAGVQWHNQPELVATELVAMTFYIRTWQSPEAAEATLRRAMQTLDSKLVLDNFRTMQEQIDDNLTSERVIAILASSFGILAVLMAAVGLYGVLAYSTAQRTREIGIRIALGAARASVMRMVLVEVLWLAGISIAFALPASLLLTHATRSQLFGISSSDPLTLVVVTLLVAFVALASALLPARRAAKTDPIVALRYE